MRYKFGRKLISTILIFALALSHTSALSAEEIQPYSTNITSGSCLLGSVTGSFTGSNMHALYYSEFQYLTSYGEYATIGDQRTFRSYTEGAFETFEAYYCNPIPGVKYRFHTNMKVYDSNDVIRDSDVINSNTLVY